ncbi:MAG: hypothetical protein DWC09_07815 [Candidatus Poseidoniales archaeon]|nr:MAG: hypothetical protein DWC09_07815 [Candidatus Poseidoniales archaeon]
MIGDFMPSVLLIFFVAVHVFAVHRKSSDEAGFEWKDMYGPHGFQALISFIVLLWILPGGFLLVGPVILLLSILSPAGRIAWESYRKPRIVVCVGLVVMLFLGGFSPVSNPVAPSEWGTPLLTENPNAPFYPSGEQYTWLMLSESGGFEVEIIQSLTLRLPYQYGPLGAESSAFTLASLFNMEQGRLNQAIEILDQELSGFRLDVDEMKLVPMLAEDTHHYSSTSAGVDESVLVRLYELRSLSIGSSDEGLKVGEVLCIATSSWGGTLEILVVVRPIGHPGLASDRYAESYAIEWLSS